MEKIFKNSALTQEDTTLLREKFIVEYSNNKGWNHKELTAQQMLEIVNQKEYKTPGIILG
jgi:hypothetical protein